jgi:prephenate dehydrogenase
MFKRVCVIGVGLIGGSFAKAARIHHLAQSIVGFGRVDDLENLQLAKQLGVIDEFYTDIASALESTDCVVLATPVASTQRILSLLKPFWSSDCVYFDVGSTKGNVMDAAIHVFGEVPDNFILAHPIAGAEQSGVSAALDDLFVGKRLIITPLPNTSQTHVQHVAQCWEKMGAIVALMDVKQHDSVLGATSHLPHLLAFALVNMLGHRDEKEDIFHYAAGGFRDFTRIASSDPAMWQAICFANKNELLPLLEAFKMQLTQMQELLESDNQAALIDLFAYANTARQKFLQQTELPK